MTSGAAIRFDKEVPDSIPGKTNLEIERFDVSPGVFVPRNATGV